MSKTSSKKYVHCLTKLNIKVLNLKDENISLCENELLLCKEKGVDDLKVQREKEFEIKNFLFCFL